MSEATGLLLLIVLVVVVVLLVVQLSIATAISNIAERKGRSKRAFFWLSFLVSWLVMLIIVVTLPENNQTKLENQNGLDPDDFGSVQVQCSFCKELVRADAVVCKHCGRDIEPALPSLLNEEQKKQVENEAAIEAEIQRIKLENDRVEAEKQLKLEARKEKREQGFRYFKRKYIIAILILLFVIAGLSFFLITTGITNGTSEASGPSPTQSEWKPLISKPTKKPLGVFGTLVDGCSHFMPVYVGTNVSEEPQRLKIDLFGNGKDLDNWLDCLGYKLNENKPSDSLSATLVNYPAEYGGTTVFQYGDLTISRDYYSLTISR